MGDNKDTGNGGKTFSEDTVAVLLMALGTKSITGAQYDLMSSLDGTRTASAFQHMFRSVLKKAKELNERVGKGEKFDPVAPVKKRAAGGGTVTPPSTPKKPKATPKPRGKKAANKSPAKVEGQEMSPTPGNDDFGTNFDKTVDQFVKKELGEDRYV